LFLAASYAGRVLRVVILMISTLLICRHRCLLIAVSAAYHLVTALLGLIRCPYHIGSSIRAYLPHVMWITITHVRFSITIAGAIRLLRLDLAVLTACITYDHCRHCSLFDRRRITFFRHRLWRINHSDRLSLLSGSGNHGDWCCAGRSPGRGSRTSLLLSAYGHLLRR
jgi:hypothetical protein